MRDGSAQDNFEVIELCSAVDLVSFVNAWVVSCVCVCAVVLCLVLGSSDPQPPYHPLCAARMLCGC